MKLSTRHFGEIEVDEDKIIDFVEGIPGFPELRKFTLIMDSGDNEATKDLFYWLQSVEDTSIAFVLVDVTKILPDYDPQILETEILPIGNFNEETFRFYNIAVLPENIRNMTVNLKAPVLINTVAKLGKQVICENEEYTVRHYLFQ